MVETLNRDNSCLVFDIHMSDQSAIKTMTYTERLVGPKLPTYQHCYYRHIGKDMIEMYKILSGKYDTAVIPRVNREYSPN